MVQKYQALVYTVCHQLVPDVQEAQDLTQETFLAAWRAIDRCPPGFVGRNGWRVSRPTKPRTICAAHGCAR